MQSVRIPSGGLQVKPARLAAPARVVEELWLVEKVRVFYK